MITEKDEEVIQRISRNYHVKRVLLFGSSIDPAKESRDIDIGVEGVSPEDFFKYYRDLVLKLSKPVDLVDLSESSKFVQPIHAVILRRTPYGAAKAGIQKHNWLSGFPLSRE